MRTVPGLIVGKWLLHGAFWLAKIVYGGPLEISTHGARVHLPGAGQGLDLRITICVHVLRVRVLIIEAVNFLVA